MLGAGIQWVSEEVQLLLQGTPIFTGAQGPLCPMGKQLLTVGRHVDVGGNWIAALSEWLVWGSGYV